MGEMALFDPAQELNLNGSVSASPMQSLQMWMSETGLELPKGISLDEWMSLAPEFRRIHSSVQWAVGDWILYGEEGQHTWGQKYTQAINDLDYAYDYLRQVVRVCKAFPRDQRRAKPLTFSHHQEVLSLPVEYRQNALTRALKEHLSVTAFRELIRGLKEPAPKQITETTPDKGVSVDIVLPSAEHRQAAELVAHELQVISISGMVRAIAEHTVTVIPTQELDTLKAAVNLPTETNEETVTVQVPCKVFNQIRELAGETRFGADVIGWIKDIVGELYGDYKK